MKILKIQHRAIFVVLIMLLSGCAMGPDYQRPQAPVAIQYKNAAPWKNAMPSDYLDKGNWWEIYADETLNRLEMQASEANQTLKAAYARLTQARAALGVSRAAKLPSVDLTGSANRSRVLLNRYGLDSGASGIIFNYYDISSVLNYEIDLFGRVKRSVEAAEASAAGATADYRNLLLSLQADLAHSYFSLRSLDSEIALLQQSIKLRQKSYDLVKSKFDNGQVGQLDLSRAESELASTQAEQIALQKQRNALENSIAVLLGQPPANFTLAADPASFTPPAVAPGLPSSLLERRPDIAAAERQMAAANARIGVAKAAFFPAISLTGNAGFGSAQVDSLFDWDNRTWALGPALSLPIFDAGRNSANLERARAAYEEAVANYRQQVLVAFQEVEDSLNGLQLLARQGEALAKAQAAANQAWEISEKRYRAGLVSYLEVVDSQRTALQAERALTQLRGEQMRTSVLLIKALGGGWQETPAG